MPSDMFMKIEGIDGECTDDAHTDWIELRRFEHGVSQPISSASATGGRTGGRADFENFSVIKTIDKATPDLNLFCANGKHIPSIEVECCLATEDKHTFMKYTLEDCIVASVKIGANPEDDRPTEEVTFCYGQVKWEYTPIDQTGAAGSATDRTWSLETNKQV